LLIAAAAVGVIAIAALVASSFLSGETEAPAQAADAQPDVVARGKYLAEAADALLAIPRPAARHLPVACRCEAASA
jgi:hypothetical protein